MIRFVGANSMFATLVIALASFTLGCSSSELGSQVEGTVTLDGQPVGPGAVVFAPADVLSNPADGAIQLDGSYFLKTSRDIGLKPGTYRVSVTAFDQPEIAPGERSMTPPKLITPSRYADPETSGLEYAVEPGKNTINIELSSK